MRMVDSVLMPLESFPLSHVNKTPGIKLSTPRLTQRAGKFNSLRIVAAFSG